MCLSVTVKMNNIKEIKKVRWYDILLVVGRFSLVLFIHSKHLFTTGNIVHFQTLPILLSLASQCCTH